MIDRLFYPLMLADFSRLILSKVFSSFPWKSRGAVVKEPLFHELLPEAVFLHFIPMLNHW